MRACFSARRGAPKLGPRVGLGLGLLAAILVLIGGGRSALAHAVLARADPPANSQLREPPEVLTLYFTEPLERRFSSARVTDGTAARLDERVEFDDRDATAMRVVLKERPAPGFLTVAWETVSSVDGHRITGSYPLTILNPDGSVAPGQPQQGSTASVSGTEVRPERAAVKWLLLITGSLIAGSLAFVLAVEGASRLAATAVRDRLCANGLQVAGFGACVLLGAGIADLLNQANNLTGQPGIGAILLSAGIISASFALGLGLRRVVTPTGQAGFPQLPPAIFFAYFIATGILIGAGIGAVLGEATEPGSNALENLSTVAFSTEWGERWLLRNGLLLPLLASVIIAGRTQHQTLQRGLLIAGLVISALALLVTSSVSHAAAVPLGSVWSIGTDFVHLLAASVWTGMLLQLAMLFVWSKSNLTRSERAPVLAAALQRFSLVAVCSVALLLLTGVVSAAIQLRGINDLLDTAYGRTLLLKLSAAAVLLAIGGVNAFVFRPKLVTTAESPDRRRPSGAWASTEEKLGRYAKAELILVAVVFAAAAVLTQVAPPVADRATGTASTGKFVATKETSDISATLVVDPNEPGENAFEVYLTGGVDVVELVRLTFIGPDGFGSRLTLDASNPPTFYVGRGAFLSKAGKWRVAVDIRRTRGADLSLAFDLTVGPVDATSSGGDLSLPISTSRDTVLLVGASALATLAFVYAGWPRQGIPAGYVGQAALRINRIRVPPLLSTAVLLVVVFGLAVMADEMRDRALSPEQASRGNPVDSSPASIDRGRILFNRNCIQCHGETGRGDGPIAASLPIPPANLYDHIPYHPDQFFYGVLTNGLSGIMPAFGSTLSEDDRWDVMNFLRDQFGQPPAEK